MQKSATVLMILAALAACSHTSQSSTTTQSTAAAASPAAASPAAASPAAASPAASSAVASSGVGATIYQTNCSSCHSASGAGMPGTFPPLAGNPVANEPAPKMIHIVKDGLTGAITVNGATYNGQMPAWSPQLSNTDIAAVVTYVRTSWGNHGGAVTAAQVAGTH